MFKSENYWEWRDKLREAIALYSDDMVDLLDGTPCPPATGANANATGATAWTMLNSKLYSILFFATEGSANITVKQFQARPQTRQKADGVGRGKHFRYASTATRKKPIAHAVRS